VARGCVSQPTLPCSSRTPLRVQGFYDALVTNLWSHLTMTPELEEAMTKPSLPEDDKVWGTFGYKALLAQQSGASMGAKGDARADYFVRKVLDPVVTLWMQTHNRTQPLFSGKVGSQDTELTQCLRSPWNESSDGTRLFTEWAWTPVTGDATRQDIELRVREVILMVTDLATEAKALDGMEERLVGIVLPALLDMSRATTFAKLLQEAKSFPSHTDKEWDCAWQYCPGASCAHAGFHVVRRLCGGVGVQPSSPTRPPWWARRARTTLSRRTRASRTPTRSATRGRTA